MTFNEEERFLIDIEWILDKFDPDTLPNHAENVYYSLVADLKRKLADVYDAKALELERKQRDDYRND
jgi:hypothetical protein